MIGQAALLEQCAEECTELAHACLKLSRKIRNENPTPKSMVDILDNLTEEAADVTLCIDELAKSKLVSYEHMAFVRRDKYDRWCERLKQ